LSSERIAPSDVAASLPHKLIFHSMIYDNADNAGVKAKWHLLLEPYPEPCFRPRPSICGKMVSWF